MPSTNKKPAASSKPAAPEPLRFAHPFFSSQPAAPGAATSPHGATMLDHIATTLGPVPPTRGDGTFTLADVIGQTGAKAIEATGRITLHVAGDTGVPEGDRETRQVSVADAMTRDYDPASPATSPAFFLHAGDVIYGGSADAYLTEYYRPNMHYPGKIVAIPGNHDGESAAKLKAFQDNFCATKQAVPAIAGSIFRETMNQPGVYWCLDAPFVQIVGLYSNNAENPGAISGGAAGTGQKTWLVQTLKKIKAQRDHGTKKALFFVTHHPPYSSGGHTGSTQMLADIDDACTQAGIRPTAHFSGHAHSIQRYVRTVALGGKNVEIPYIVTGCGGHGGQTIAPSPGVAGANPFYAFGYVGWGYTRVDVTAHDFTIKSFGVDWTKITEIDTVTYKI